MTSANRPYSRTWPVQVDGALHAVGLRARCGRGAAPVWRRRRSQRRAQRRPRRRRRPRRCAQRSGRHRGAQVRLALALQALAVQRWPRRNSQPPSRQPATSTPSAPPRSAYSTKEGGSMPVQARLNGSTSGAASAATRAPWSQPNTTMTRARRARRPGPAPGGGAGRRSAIAACRCRSPASRRCGTASTRGRSPRRCRSSRTGRRSPAPVATPRRPFGCGTIVMAP